MHFIVIMNNFKQFNTNFERFLHPNVKEFMKRKYNLSPDDLRRMYIKSVKIPDENLAVLVDLWSDLIFVEGIHRAVKIQTEKSSAPTYLYQFSYNHDSPLKQPAGINISGNNMNIFNTMYYHFCRQKMNC